MSFTVILYSFNKKENSTKRPTSVGASFNCVIKEESGVVNPSIELDLGLASSPSSYNYAYIEEFDRYYWIEEWTNIYPLWRASLKVDVLATYKDIIGNTPLYVLRASNEYDGSIIDTLYPTKIKNSVSIISPDDDLWTPTPLASGTFIIGVVASYGAFGGISYHAIEYSNMRTLIQKLLQDGVAEPHGFSVNDATIELQKALIDPLQYIKSCIYIPYPISHIVGNLEESLKIWDWTMDIPNKELSLNNTVVINNAKFDLPSHPQATSRGMFTNVAPYTEITYSDGIFGDIPLDTVRLAYDEELDINLRVDVTNGLGTLSIYSGNYLMNRINAPLGTSIQLSQVTRSLGGIVANAFIGNSNTAIGVLGGISSVAMGGGFSDGAKAVQPRLSSVGGDSSGFSKYELTPRLYIRYMELVDDDISCNGRPLCKIKTPSSLGGYMLIQDADVSIVGTSNELSQVKSFLEGGFYYE